MRCFPEFEPYCTGIVLRFGQPPIRCYDYDQVIAHFEFNVIGAWLGDDTPCFLTTDVERFDVDNDAELDAGCDARA